MHIARQTQQELVVVDGTRWLSLLFLVAALFILSLAVTRHDIRTLFVAAFFLLFAALFARHSTFTLDAMQRIVRWHRHTVLKNETGSIPFDSIQDIVIDAQSGDRGAMSYRLSIVTADGPTPMANFFSGGRIEHYQHLRQQILKFIGIATTTASAAPDSSSALGSADGIPADLASSLRTLLAQGRKIDAVSLLRTRQNLSLADAVSRVNAFDQETKPG